MIRKRRNNFTAKDCSPVELDGEECTKSDQEFLSLLRRTSNSINIFSISKRARSASRDPIVYYDYGDAENGYKGVWKAGRYIGNIEYTKDGKKYSLLIEPRFGNKTLLEMLGEIININLSSGESKFKNQEGFYIKLLISLIWSQKLVSASRYGFPRTYIATDNRGYSLKGRLLVKPSIFTHAKDQSLVSQSYEKTYDEVVLSIIYAAFLVLRRDFAFEKLNVSSNVKELLIEIDSICHRFKKLRITAKDYYSISYNPIFQSYKELVDLSWHIIHYNPGISALDSGSNISGYMIDMAEIWECYIRQMLQRELRGDGWELINNSFSIYDNTFYRRTIIPDIVFKRRNEYCVLDAKYKKMEYRVFDVDREDLFQIHMYISYLQQIGNVKLAGLIYPIESKAPIEIRSATLFGLQNNCKFFADGPYVGNGDVNTKHFCEIIREEAN